MVKDDGSTKTLFAYDGSSLLHEDNGATPRDYIYLHGEPIGLVQGGVLYYVHSDHLARPEVVTDGAKVVKWQRQNNAWSDVPTTDLIGGLNTYSYARENPLSFIDSLGLSTVAVGTELGGLVLASACAGAPEACQAAGQACQDIAHSAMEGYEDLIVWQIKVITGMMSESGNGDGANPPQLEKSGTAASPGGPDDDDFVPPPLRRLHSDETITGAGNRASLESVQRMSTRDIIKSLRPGSSKPLRVKSDGTIMDGNTRVYVLEKRGVDVNTLPRTPYP